MKKKSGVKIHIALLNYASSNKMLKPYAMYLSAKAKYKHTIIYNFTYRKLSRIFGIDHKTAKRYTKKLLRHGFAKIHSGHLLFVAPEKVIAGLGLVQYYDDGREEDEIKSQYSTSRQMKRFGGKVDKNTGDRIEKRLPYYRVEAFPYTSIKGIYNRILYIALRNNARTQEFRSRIRTGKSSGKISLNAKEARKIIRRSADNPEKTMEAILNFSRYDIPIIDTFIQYEEDENLKKANSFAKETFSDIYISCSGASRLFGVSRATAGKYLRRLQKKGWIHLRQVIEKLPYEPQTRSEAENIALQLNSLGNGYHFVYNNRVYKHYGRSISFLLKYNANLTTREYQREIIDRMITSKEGLTKKKNGYIKTEIPLPNKKKTKSYVIFPSYNTNNTYNKYFNKESEINAPYGL